jgi:hypothetical protein
MPASLKGVEVLIVFRYGMKYNKRKEKEMENGDEES